MKKLFNQHDYERIYRKIPSDYPQKEKKEIASLLIELATIYLNTEEEE